MDQSGAMNRIHQGWALTKVSWTVLRSDRSLAAFPVLAAIAALLAAAAFGIPSLLFFDDDMTVPGVIFAAVAIYVVTFAAVFFNVALAAAAAQVLDGARRHRRQRRRRREDAPARHLRVGGDGRQRQHRDPLAPAAHRADRRPAARRHRRRMEPGDVPRRPGHRPRGTGPIDTLKRSAAIFRERWGEQVTGQFSIGAVIGLASIIPAALLVGIGVLIGGAVAIGFFVGLAAIIVVVAGILSTALTQIFAVALYRYATGQGATGAFTEATLANSIVPRKARPARSDRDRAVA